MVHPLVRLRFLPWLLVLIPCAYFGLITGPFINEDSVFGLLAARDFHAGAPWNHLFFPDPVDLVQVRTAFLAWWAPAQWVVPDLLHQIGLPLGWALTATSVAALASGLAGWARLYRRLGYAEPVVIGSLIFVALSVYFWRRLPEYHGGEVLLFAALPWIVIAALRIGLRWPALGLLPALFLVGGFVKLSFEISALAIVAFLWVKTCRGRADASGTWRAAVIGAVSFLLFHVVFHAVYLSRGVTPDACTGPTSWSELAFMPSGPLSFLIAGQQLSGRLFGELAGAALWSWAAVASIAALALIGLAVRRAPTRDAAMAAAVFSAVNITAVAYLCWRGNRVWFIDRMFMPAGLMLLPALVQVALGAGGVLIRGAVGGLLVVATLYSIAHGIQYARWLPSATAVSPQHVRHFGLDAATMAQWLRLDSPGGPNATAFFADPGAASLALEWKNWRPYVPAYAAIYGMIDGGPANLRGRPSALRVVAFEHSRPEFAAESVRPRFGDVPAGNWHATTIGRVVVWEAAATSEGNSR